MSGRTKQFRFLWAPVYRRRAPWRINAPIRCTATSAAGILKPITQEIRPFSHFKIDYTTLISLTVRWRSAIRLSHLMVYSRVPSSFSRSSLFGVVILCAMDFFPLRKKVSGVQMLLASRLFKGSISIGPLKQRRSSFQLWRKNTSMVYSCRIGQGISKSSASVLSFKTGEDKTSPSPFQCQRLGRSLWRRCWF